MSKSEDVRASLVRAIVDVTDRHVSASELNTLTATKLIGSSRPQPWLNILRIASSRLADLGYKVMAISLEEANALLDKPLVQSQFLLQQRTRPRVISGGGVATVLTAAVVAGLAWLGWRMNRGEPLDSPNGLDGGDGQ